MKSKLFIIPLALIFLATLASAGSVGVSLFYESTSSNSLTINDGGSTEIIVSADSIFENSMNIEINLVRASNLEKVKDILESTTSSDTYSRQITIGPASYEEPGKYLLIATVTGQSGQTSTDSLQLEVLALEEENTLPTISDVDNQEVNENSPYSYQIEATDADGDTLTYRLTQRPSWISINSNTGQITGTSIGVDSDREYVITVEVSDDKGTVRETFTLTVRNIPTVEPPTDETTNNAPVITSTPVTTVNEGKSYSYQFTATDADGDSLTYSFTPVSNFWLSMNSNGLITGIAPMVTTDTSYTVKAIVSDGKDTRTQEYSIIVKDVSETPTESNHAPLITSTPNRIIDEGKTYSYQVTATDEDNDQLTYTLMNSPEWLSMNSKTGLISGVAGSVETDKSFLVKLSVTDGKGRYAYQAYYLKVIDAEGNVPDVKHAPRITSTPNTQVNESSTYRYDVQATDADGDTLTYSLTQAPNWLSINSNTGLITGTAPAVNSREYFAITIKVSDGGFAVEQRYTLSVLNTGTTPVGTNHAPVITSNPSIQINENKVYSYKVTATDADGDSLTYSLASSPNWLSINSNTGLIIGTAPAVDSDKTFLIKVKVSDGKSNTEQSYILTVKDVTEENPQDNPRRISSGPTRENGVTTLPLDEYYNAQYENQFNPISLVEEDETQTNKVSESRTGKLIVIGFSIIILAIMIFLAVVLLRRL